MKDKRKKILIVDPDGGTAQELSSIFLAEGYDAKISGSVCEMAEMIREAKYHCVIIDVDLPEMKGYEAARLLKVIDPDVRVIITASQNSVELEAEVRKQDIFYYYLKSFEREELVEAVRDVFREKGKLGKVREMSKPHKVLVIDDDPTFVTAITPILESRGYQLEAAYNKEDGMEKIGRFKPDLILLDIMMEKLTDGFDLCHKLKDDPEMSKIPVLAISAINKEIGMKFSPKTDGQYFQADDFMEKPVSPENLLERVEKLLKV